MMRIAVRSPGPLAVSALLALAPSAGAQDQRLASKPMDFPHPGVSEVLFNVPGGDHVDPNQDGERSAVGDEFIELINPHDEAIDLEGYTLRDMHQQVDFTFPALTLEPGGTTVLFNGYESHIPGPIAGPAAEAPAPNESFHGAYVFTMANTKRTNALSNSGDQVILAAPGGAIIDIVEWGTIPMRGYITNPRRAHVKSRPGCSVARPNGVGEPVPHLEINGALYSPGTTPGE